MRMKVRIGLFLLIAIVVLFSACHVPGGIQNPDGKNASNGNITRDQAIQTIKNISNDTGDMDINSYPEMDKVVDNVRYYFIEAIFANRMTAAYYIDEKEGNVFIAMGGELDTENPLVVTESDETETISSDEESGEAREVTEIIASETTVLKDIFDTIGMSAEEVEQKFGENYNTVYIDYDGYMEGFLYSDRGLTVSFGESGKVTHVYCTDKIEINGAKSGMNFSEIQEILGETSFIQTWAEIPINTAYKIEYNFNDRNVVFFSREKDGDNSIMCIS